MEHFIGILGVLIFVVSSYYMGNKTLGSERDNVSNKVVNAFAGTIIWCIFALTIILLYAIYIGIIYLLTQPINLF